jgi:hypothetical protein
MVSAKHGEGVSLLTHLWEEDNKLTPLARNSLSADMQAGRAHFMRISHRKIVSSGLRRRLNVLSATRRLLPGPTVWLPARFIV